MIRCCCETLCTICWDAGFTKDDVFICPFKCGRPTEEVKAKRLTNKFLLERMNEYFSENNQMIRLDTLLECSYHRGNMVSYFDTEKVQFGCKDCTLSAP